MRRSHVIALDDITRPRRKTCGDYPAGERRDSGMHTHFGGRVLFLYAGDDSIISIPTTVRPSFDDQTFEEGKDYIIQPAVFVINGEQKSGFRTFIAPNRGVMVAIGEGMPHSFDGIGGNSVVVSVHTNQRAEADTLEKLHLTMQDASKFVALPKTLTAAEIEEYERVRSLLKKNNTSLIQAPEMYLPSRQDIGASLLTPVGGSMEHIAAALAHRNNTFGMQV